MGIAMGAHAAQEVSLVFAGDTVLDDAAGELIAQGGDPFADFESYLKNADIRIANLECVVSTLGQAGDKVYTFKAHPRVLTVLKNILMRLHWLTTTVATLGPRHLPTCCN